MKRLLCLVCAFVLLTGCAPAAPAREDTLNIVATTYPTYLAALAVTKDVEGISVSRLDTGSVSCLHDYTLTVNDMKKLSQADVIVINGAGLEEFMSDALAATDAHVIDCSEGVELLPATGHYDHDHSGEDHGHFDPHYWMDPLNAHTMVDNVRRGLWFLFPGEVAPQLSANTTLAGEQLWPLYELGLNYLYPKSEHAVFVPGLITFHDGFQYLAHAFHLPLLRSIEEEAGSEASAKEMDEIIQLVRNEHIPVIFTEVNGSDATANAIARETGCAVAQLSMLMDGREPTEEDSSPITPYTELMLNNIYTLINGFAGREVLSAP